MDGNKREQFPFLNTLVGAYPWAVVFEVNSDLDAASWLAWTRAGQLPCLAPRATADERL